MTSLETAIREKLKLDNVTFAELSRIDGFKGSFELLSPAKDNVVFWQGVSEEAADILNRLRDDGVYHFKPASSLLVYLADGVCLKLPVAKRSRHYKEPHWLPVVLKLGRATS